MSPLRSAGLYARRALELAARSNKLERWRDDLRLVAATPVSEVLGCCRWQDGDLMADESAIAAHIGDVLPEVADFACLLARNNKEAILPDIAAEYSRLLNEYYGVRQAEVTTATPLDESGRRMIESRLRAIAGSSFTLDEHVDPSIVGGIILRVGDRIIDRSVRARLRTLRDLALEGEDEL
ncbi:MAG: ATP synthase F1 subunit delta [Dehalococcoidia bacterium]|nr:ATP synthase F1 subunit delta [Dehalococcoidia bacterium]